MQYPEGCAVKTDGREGTVVAVEGDSATVMLEADAACGQGMACAHCSLFKPESHTIHVRRGDLAQGDRVRLVVSARSAYRSIALLFLLPMGLAIVGYVVGAHVATSSSDLGGVLGCIAGFVLAVAVALVVNRRLAGVSDLVVERIGHVQAGE